MPDDNSVSPAPQTSAATDAARPDAGWDEDEQQNTLRWRRAILKLSETLLAAADEHRELSPFLLEAMHYALENLLVYGDETDLMTLEEWLTEESPAEGSATEESASEEDVTNSQRNQNQAARSF